MIGLLKPVQDLLWADGQSIMDIYEFSAGGAVLLTTEMTPEVIGVLIRPLFQDAIS